MKTMMSLLILLMTAPPGFAQSRMHIDFDRYKYPEDLYDAKSITVTELQQLTEQQILNALPDTDFFLDSTIRESMRCIALYRFKMNFFRNGEKGIVDVESDFNKISFEMKLILKNAQPGDVVQFDYIQCVRPDYDYRKRSGVRFLVMN